MRAALRSLLQVYLLDAVLRLSQHVVTVVLVHLLLLLHHHLLLLRHCHGDSLNFQEADEAVGVDDPLLLLVLVGHGRPRVQLRLLDDQGLGAVRQHHWRHLLLLLQLDSTLTASELSTLPITLILQLLLLLLAHDS